MSILQRHLGNTVEGGSRRAASFRGRQNGSNKPGTFTFLWLQFIFVHVSGKARHSSAIGHEQSYRYIAHLASRKWSRIGEGALAHGPSDWFNGSAGKPVFSASKVFWLFVVIHCFICVTLCIFSEQWVATRWAGEAVTRARSQRKSTARIRACVCVSFLWKLRTILLMICIGKYLNCPCETLMLA